MTAVTLDKVTKRFGTTLALDAISLNIEAGELFFLLGPSGCGKSTLLRLIAGLHEPTGGRLLFNGRDVTRLGTDKRNAVMCFQSYALWPHMSVRENVRFGLDVRKVPADKQTKRVDEVLRLVQMERYADRKPNQLSGGQQQRVALARALAVNPACLLLDEPLSNLDAKLRHEMRSEIRRICKEAGFTTIYVTHDQKEALSVADRIAILRDGRLEQLGTPHELYRQPASSFVADFIGQTNLFKAKIVSRDEAGVSLDSQIGPLRASAAPASGEDVMVSLRPEHIRIDRYALPREGQNHLSGRPVESTFLGESSEHLLKFDGAGGGATLKVISTPPMLDTPPTLSVNFDPADVVVLAQ
jgi:iron(III) transport system ATP-binding protein